MPINSIQEKTTTNKTSPDQFSISIIIVNWNAGRLLLECLQSIAKADLGPALEIIVVDNCSQDGSLEHAQTQFPTLIAVRSRENRGFASACNLGLNLAHGEYILLLNPDTLVSPNTFTALLHFMDHTPEAGAAGCRVLNEDGTLQTTCRRRFPTPLISFLHLSRFIVVLRRVSAYSRTILVAPWLQRRLPGKLQRWASSLERLLGAAILSLEYEIVSADEFETREVDALSGAFLLTRTDLLRALGGLDEAFFLFGEDLDLCYRIKQHNHKIFYVPTTTIMHYRGRCREHTPIRSIAAGHQAMVLFHQKHLSPRYPNVLNSLIYYGISCHEQMIAGWVTLKAKLRG